MTPALALVWQAAAVAVATSSVAAPQDGRSAGTGTFAAVARAGGANGPHRVLVHVAGKWTPGAGAPGGRIQWSPDGRFIAVSAETGRTGPIWVIAPGQSGEPWKVTDAGADPAWAPDSARLAYARDGGGLAVAEVAARAVRDVPGSERGYAPAWAPSGETLAFARAEGGSGSVWTVGRGGGTASRLAFCARPLALAWDARGTKLAVVEHDPGAMDSPRLSVLAPSDPAPTPLCAVPGPPVRWASDDRIEVGDRPVRIVAVGQSHHRTEPAPTRPVPPLPAGLILVTVAWTPAMVTAPTALSIPPPSLGEEGRGPGIRPPDVVLPSIPVVSPMVFPVCGPVTWSDTFGHPRGGARKHAGQDIMAPKLRPVVAAFDGVVTLRKATAPGGHNWLILQGDNGWIATYLHLNNDTPGTDDGLGTDEHAYAPGLVTGARVVAGQLIGYVGDSGNAEGTAPHLHFELAPAATRLPMNPAASLELATRLDAPRTP